MLLAFRSYMFRCIICVMDEDPNNSIKKRAVPLIFQGVFVHSYLVCSAWSSLLSHRYWHFLWQKKEERSLQFLTWKHFTREKKKEKKEVFYAYSTGNTVPYVKWLGHRTNSTYFWTHIFGQKYSGTGTWDVGNRNL